MKALFCFILLCVPSAFGARDFFNPPQKFTTNNWAGSGTTISNFTVSIWAFPYPPVAVARSMFLICDTTAANQFYMGRNASASTFRLQNYDGSNLYIDSAAQATNVWLHFVGVRSSTTNMVFWINGVPIGTNTSGQTYTSDWATNISISKYPMGMSDAQREFNGALAEFGFWNVGLTDSEILSLSQGFAPSRVRPSSLISYIPLYGHGETTGAEIDIIRGPMPRYSGSSNAVVFPHPRIYR